jgi:hypothetical protein
LVGKPKILVVKAIQAGLLAFYEASKRYSLSPEEYVTWQKLAGTACVVSRAASMCEAFED